MPFSELDTAAVARSLSQIADRDEDLADVFFERRETIEVAPAEEVCGGRRWQSEGFAIRLLRDGRSWLASRDRIESALFTDALRQVARILPPALYSPPVFHLEPISGSQAPVELLEFPQRVIGAIRDRLVGFPLRLRARLHRRWVRVVEPLMVADQQSEEFYSFEAETPWGRTGALLADLDQQTIDEVATGLISDFRIRELPPLANIDGPVVLGPAASAVLLHEAVAHALETDTLSASGRPEAAVGVQLGGELLNVLDTPADGPLRIRRTTDDEGVRVVRRWLLRAGVVEQPLADRATAHRSASLTAGAGRRGDHHLPPVPRSTHLELLPGSQPFTDLVGAIADGHFFAQATRGALDPLTGMFDLTLAGGRRVVNGALDAAVGTARLRGRVPELLREIQAVGNERRPTGAGWCAKGGIRLPVWATTPAILLEPGSGQR